MKSKLVAGATAVAVAAAVGASFSTAASPKKFSIAYIPPVIANPSIRAMNDAMGQKAKQLGMSFSTVGGEYNPAAQVVAMNAVIQRKFDAVAVWPLDPNGLRPSLDKAKKAGMTVLVEDSPGDKGSYDIDLRFDDQAAAAKVAELGAKAVKASGKPCAAGIIQGIPVVQILNWRNIGLEQGLKKAGCTILNKQVNVKDITDGARPIADAWKTKYGNKMTLVVAYNDPSAAGAISALDSSWHPLITGFNGDQIAINAIKQGTLYATVEQPSVEIGNVMAQTIFDKLSGKSVPSEIWMFQPILTKKDLATFKTPEQKVKLGPMTVEVAKRGAIWVATAK
jgi:ribose transport system substrate-binding protein